MSGRLPWTVVLLTWSAAVLALWPSHGVLLDTDEVDYLGAARLGVTANALEAGSLTPREFLRFGLAKLRHTEAVLPPGYDEDRDPFLLRHFHPPLVTYLLAVVGNTRSERVVRLIQLTGALAMIVVTFVAYRRIGGTFTGLGAGVVALLVLWESVMVFQSVTFHGWEAVWMVTVAALLPQWIIDPFSPRSRLALAAALAMAVLTLESGLFACAAVAVCFVVWRKKSGAGGRSAMRPLTHLAVLVLVIVCVLWPGAIIRASLIKTPAMYLYRIRLGSEYASVAGGLPTLLRTLLPVLIMGPLASVWLFARHRADIRRWGPPGVLALVYGLSVSRFSLRADYLVPALAPLVCLVGVACDRIGEMRLRVAVAISALTLVAGSWPATRIEAADLAARADLQWLGDLAAGRKSFIAGGNGIPYYLDASAATKPLTVTPDGLSSREAGAYRLLTPSDIAGSLVVLPRRLPALGPRDERIVAACSRIERPTLVVYDCAATTPDGR